MKKLIYLFLFFSVGLFGQYPQINKQIVFAEYFDSEAKVIQNGGTPTDIDFAYGKGAFNGTSSKVNYDLNLNGTYSVRVKCNPTSFAGYRTLFNTVGSNSDGSGYIYLNITTGNISAPGTKYVNGFATTTVTAGIVNDIIITGVILIQGTGVNLSLIGSNHVNGYEFLGTIDLFEIWEGTLSAETVENMFLGRTNHRYPDQTQTKQLTSRIIGIAGVISDLYNSITNTGVVLIKQNNFIQSYNGSTSNLAVGNIDTVNTLNFILYYDGTDQSGIIDLDGGTNTVEHSGGTLTYWGDDAYINGVNTNTLTYGWNYITIIDNTGTVATAYRIGYDGSNYFKGSIFLTETYYGVFTLLEHNQFWSYNKKYLK